MSKLFYNIIFRRFLFITVVLLPFIIGSCIGSAAPAASRILHGISQALVLATAFIYFSYYCNKPKIIHHPLLSNKNEIIKAVYKFNIKTYPKNNENAPLSLDIEDDYNYFLCFSNRKKSLVARAYVPNECWNDKKKYIAYTRELVDSFESFICKYYLVYFLMHYEELRKNETRLNDVVSLIKIDYGYDFNSLLTPAFYIKTYDLVNSSQENRSILSLYNEYVNDLKLLLASYTSICILSDAPLLKHGFRDFLIHNAEHHFDSSSNFSKFLLSAAAEYKSVTIDPDDSNYFSHIHDNSIENVKNTLSYVEFDLTYPSFAYRVIDRHD